MAEAIKNVGSPANGVREVSRLTSSSGVANRTTTVISVNDAAVLDQIENNGVPKHIIRGDGRVWVPVLSGPPASPVSGDIWLEQDISLGTVLRIKTPSGLLTISSSGISGSAITYTATAALLQGHACYLDPTNGPLYAQAFVDSNHLYRVRGLVLADTLLGGQVELVTDGETLTVSDWSLMTGSATLTQGATYWLSATPGRFTTTPDAAVASMVGYALTPTTMMVQTGPAVLP